MTQMGLPGIPLPEEIKYTHRHYSVLYFYAGALHTIADDHTHWRYNERLERWLPSAAQIVPQLPALPERESALKSYGTEPALPPQKPFDFARMLGVAALLAGGVFVGVLLLSLWGEI